MREIPPVPTEERIRNAQKRAFEIAAQHVEAQKAVWGMTNIPIEHLLDLIAKNLRAMKDYEFK